MLHPPSKLLGRRLELHGIRGIRALHHHALEKIASHRAICSAEALVIRNCVGVGGSPERWDQRHGVTRHGAGCVAAEYLFSRDERFEGGPSPFVCRRAEFGHHIEHDERAASEVVAAFEGFAVGLHEAAVCEPRQGFEGGAEAVDDCEQCAVAIPHCAAWGVDECAPAVEFWFGIPQSALRWGEL